LKVLLTNCNQRKFLVCRERERERETHTQTHKYTHTHEYTYPPHTNTPSTNPKNQYHPKPHIHKIHTKNMYISIYIHTQIYTSTKYTQNHIHGYQKLFFIFIFFFFQLSFFSAKKRKTVANPI